MSFEEAFTYSINGKDTIGIIHHSVNRRKTGLLIIVGGPQYRVGSHRQFVSLARKLASNGTPVMRFDYRGIGDGAGDFKGFLHIQEDIKVSIDHFINRVKDIEKIVLWGLCDAASAALLYAYKDTRVSGMVLLNPWVRTDETLAETYLKNYYLKRFISKDFWVKFLQGRLNIKNVSHDLLSNINKVLSKPSNKETAQRNPESIMITKENYIDQMLFGLGNFSGKILLVLSENDLTADEFKNLVENSKKWKHQLEKKTIQIEKVEKADHTFSKKEWKDKVAEFTLQWITRFE